MKKIYFMMVFTLVLSAASVVKAQSNVSAFVGMWSLDREKTPAKDLPTKLKNYKMSVGESENLLSIESLVEGPVEIVDSRNRSSNTSTVVNNTDSRTSKPTTNGVSASNTGSDVVEKSNYGGTMALFFTPQQIKYNLTGEEVKVDIKNGTARFKMKADKNGKSLQFTTIRRTKTVNGEMEIITREWWKMAEDGKTIKLQRTVETPSARDEITMMLTKVVP